MVFRKQWPGSFLWGVAVLGLVLGGCDPFERTVNGLPEVGGVYNLVFGAIIENTCPPTIAPNPVIPAPHSRGAFSGSNLYVALMGNDLSMRELLDPRGDEVTANEGEAVFFRPLESLLAKDTSFRGSTAMKGSLDKKASFVFFQRSGEIRLPPATDPPSGDIMIIASGVFAPTGWSGTVTYNFKFHWYSGGDRPPPFPPCTIRVAFSGTKLA